MTTSDKKYFSKSERLEILISLQQNTIDAYNRTIMRIEKNNNTITQSELIKVYNSTINILLTRLNKLKNYSLS